MANHLLAMLEHWYLHRQQSWVLATIYATDGSSYRKPGAMMMINDLGQYHGLLSGGCLESDIMLQARRCWDNGKNRCIEYDMREEEDLAWKLGIGCGGMVQILLQPVLEDNNYLSLLELRDAQRNNRACVYQQYIDDQAPRNQLLPDSHLPQQQSSLLTEDNKELKFLFRHAPPLQVAVFGGGVDARPVVALAGQMGWRVTLIDHRSGYARAGYFDDAERVVRLPADQLSDAEWLSDIDAAVIMTHSVSMDGAALALMQQSEAKYIGMLGPTHRTQRVLDNINSAYQQLSKPLFNPIGLDIGGELPEAIALSITAQIQAFFAKRDGGFIASSAGQ